MARLKIEKNWSQVPNQLNNSSEISLKAKGMYSYLNGKPADWDFASYRIANEIKESEGAVKSALKELETHGYLVRNKYQNAKGHWKVEYTLKQIPSYKNPTKENPTYENPTIGKLYNKETYNKQTYNKENNKKDVDKSTTSPKEKTYKDKPISKLDIEPILQDIGRDSTEGYSLRIAKHLNNFFIKYYQELGLKPTKYMVGAKTGKEMVHIKSLLNSYQEKYIRDVIKFLTKEKSKDAEFWRGNVRSCKGFKDKFDKLVIAMKNKRDDKNNML